VRFPQTSRDGRRIVYQIRTDVLDGLSTVQYNYDLFLWEGERTLREAEGSVRRLTRAGAYLSGFAFSAGGKWLAYAFDKTREGDNEYFLMNVDSGEVRPFRLPDRPDGIIEPGTPPR
jgi:hypothetical protein